MEKANKQPVWIWLTIGVLSILAVVVVIAVLIESSGTETVTVPNILGLTEAQATQALDNVGLKMETQDSYSQSEIQKTGTIVAQDPVQGSVLDEGSTVTAAVTVEMRMPDLLGMTQTEAVNTLKAQGLSEITVGSTPVLESAKIGAVVTQSPLMGTLITPETAVSLQVGGEVETVIVPFVLGLDEATAVTQLKSAGLVAKVTEQASQLEKPGVVLSQSPMGGQPVQTGSTVNIVVSAAAPANTTPSTTP